MEVQGLAAESFCKRIIRKKMKVGILTFHRAHNYGAVLQCYALQEILRSRGHDVCIIDYRQKWIDDFYKIFSIDMIRSECHGAADVFAYLKKNVKKFILAPCKALNFRSFRNEYLTLTTPCTDQLPQDIDCYVIGSDQLWSLHCLGGQTDPVYMGRFDRPAGSKVVGYAISADVRSIDAVADKLGEWIDGFDAISVRESGIAERIQECTGRMCDVCLDPTLITNADLWTPVIDDRWSKRNYVLVYEVRRLKENKGLLRRKAQEIADKIGNGCEVIDLSAGNHSVRDFVSLFKYARHVVTTSFHGTVFSILFERPFHVLPLWNGYDLRYLELLRSIGAEDRVVAEDESINPENPDFVPMKAKLAVKVSYSLQFIDNALRNGE